MALFDKDRLRGKENAVDKMEAERSFERLNRKADAKVIGAEEIAKATEILTKYKRGKTNLEKRISDLEKLIDSLEETISSKNEIITMLKKSLGEEK